MSDKKIQVELDETLVRNAVMGCSASRESVFERLGAALTPEYPEGTIAWLTLDNGNLYIAFREGGVWKDGPRGETYRPAAQVEPLRVLADDEAAVDAEVLSSLASMWRESANTRSFITARFGPLAHRIDQLVDTEARP